MDISKLVDELLNILNYFKQSVFAFLPKAVGAALILLFGFFVARLVKTLIVGAINRVDRFIPNQKLRTKVRSFFEEKPIAKVIGGILYWILVLFFLTVATETLGLPVVTTWLSGIAGYLPKILTAFLIVIAGVIGGVILRDLIATTLSSARILYGSFLGRTVQIVVLLITILIAIDQLGIDVSLLENVLIIAIGALLFGAALAFGTGAKTSVSNILASYYLQKVYSVGDKVRIEGQEGRIIKITPIAIIIDSADGQTCIPADKFNRENSVLISKEEDQ